MKSINIATAASVEGLRETLEMQAHKRALRFPILVARVYRFAVENPDEFSEPLESAGESPGKHIGAEVSDPVAKQLDTWAKELETTRSKLCLYILQKAVENDCKLLHQILKKKP